MPPAEVHKRRRLGQILIDLDYITANMLKQYLEIQKRTADMLLGDLLLRDHIVTIEQIAEAVEEQKREENDGWTDRI